MKQNENGKFADRVNEPLIVADGGEEFHGLGHAVDILVLQQFHVVAIHGDAEYYRRHALKAVDPLFALATLPADVKELEMDPFVGEVGLDDAGGLDAGTQNVLQARNVVGIGETVQRAEVVRGGIVELVFLAAAVALLHAGIQP